jgi:hypothetical protein
VLDIIQIGQKFFKVRVKNNYSPKVKSITVRVPTVMEVTLAEQLLVKTSEPNFMKI